MAGVVAWILLSLASLALDRGGKVLRIYAVNSTASERSIAFHLQGFATPAAGQVRVFTLGGRTRARDSEVMNTHDDPNRVSMASTRIVARGGKFDCAFEPFTVTLLEIELGGRR